MKKQLPKPENWQDFESLCKKLWGEIWEIPYKIKKNGRIGQPQNGVDISGIPRGQSGYWGIQCKGKDEYTHSKLTESEVDNEIKKAKNFKPELEVFIIATTSNKDSKIEEYIRLKDIDNRGNNGFEIILFCWEDIVDLIEEDRSTFQFYVNDKQFKDKYDFEIFFDNDKYEKKICPMYHRKIKKWLVKKGDERDLIYQIGSFHKSRFFALQTSYLNRSFNNTNTAICEFGIKLKNTGTVVIENWFVVFKLIGRHKPIDEMRFHSGGIPNFGFNTLERKVINENEVKFYPTADNPLIQGDEKEFDIEIIPLPEQYEIKIEWHLKARDFQKRGEVILKVDPVFEDEEDYVLVDHISDLKETEIVSLRENRFEIDDDKKTADL